MEYYQHYVDDVFNKQVDVVMRTIQNPQYYCDKVKVVWFMHAMPCTNTHLWSMQSGVVHACNAMHTHTLWSMQGSFVSYYNSTSMQIYQYLFNLYSKPIQKPQASCSLTYYSSTKQAH
jgi:hypothetical protein